MDAWEQRLADLWAAVDSLSPEAFRARMEALAGERPPGDAVAPLYREALTAGLTGIRRRRAVIQLVLAVIPAGATAPGENGEITFRRYVGPGDGVSTIFTIRPDGTGERQVSHLPEGTFDEFPDYAADGSLIAFARCGPPVCKVMVARPDGSGVREVSPRCKRPPTGDRVGPGCSENFYPALRLTAFASRSPTSSAASETSRSTTAASTPRV